VKDWTVKQCENAKPGISKKTGEPIPKRYCISQSLYLIVMPDMQRRLAFRYTKPSTGKVTEAGLGRWGDVTLDEAKDERDKLRRLVRQGGDPVEQKRGKSAADATFASVAADYLAVAERRFRNPGSVRNVKLLLLTHAADLGPKPIANIGTAHIDAALRPLWLTSPDQARRAVAACLRVLKFAKAKGLTAASTADMREDMSHLLPHVNGTKRHFAALDYKDVPAFVRELRQHQVQSEALSPAVIEFILLTACRENEACGMQWREVDWEQGLWILPAARSKTGREHQVPLCDTAIRLLTRQRWPNGQGLDPDPDSYVWPGRNGDGCVTGKSVYKYLTKTMGLKITVHGFRSSFRDWAGDTTPFARDHVEECLGHVVGNAVERAYRRSDALEKRRKIMQEWAAFCEPV
jgi:integrase